ncbi:TetR/AcrR family transcriptional regulator [Levilactobacillus acidifarinae]|uniref:HTH tetR-type domain-containing protein n=1 Tax=Levilactobacillus acidifarinae DSM 19394 = JCM 15949 TaxID=1423715 RepID=A0A0R1LGT6_9LACO|nr:TetR/AcrR family transcriptional regulator [Levilactobacillus acidifarinae]KRK95110.1 hypothetical protein FD25_GL001647 [Levilactobacillus acidifarinae DSM 19394]GEO70831.1 hypothetical protein LAC03_27410 [Levilactobacillus acidifarinae]
MKVQHVRATETDQKIRTAFLALLEKRPLDKITIANITQGAQVNRATFYAHYQDKYDLFEQMMATSVAEVLPLSWRQVPMAQRVVQSCRAIQDYLQQIKTHCPFSYQELFPMVEKEFLPVLIDLIQQSAPNAEDRFRDQLRARVIYQAVATNLVTGAPLPLETVIEVVQDFHF